MLLEVEPRAESLAGAGSDCAALTGCELWVVVLPVPGRAGSGPDMTRASSETMVPVACASACVAPTAPLRVTVKASFGSRCRSPLIVITKLRLVCPAGIVSPDNERAT